MTLKTVVIAENSLDQSTWQTFETENILDFLVLHFGQWPETARIYNKEVSQITDVTPTNENDIKALSEMEGPFYVIVFPGTVAVVAIIMAIIAIAIVILMPKPKIPNATIRNSDSPSSNNELSGRVNRERINGRIPDIFGEVRSVPDLISLPYTFFENNVEKEHSYMCIGRGEFEFNDVREDTTPFSEISNSSAEIYGPYTSPNSGDSPILTVGDPIGIPIRVVKRFTSVNGQVLTPDQTDAINDLSIIFTQTKLIENIGGGSVDFTDYFSPGDTITVSNAIVYHEGFPGHPIEFANYDGTYTITTVNATEIYIADVSSNTDWTFLVTSMTDSEVTYPVLLTEDPGFTGPFVIDRTDNEEVWCNFVAQNGLYRDDGTNKISFPVTILLNLTPVDSSNTPIGAAEEFQIVMQWTGISQLQVGVTLKANPTFTGRCMVRVRRLTPMQIFPGNQVVQEVKWRDLYGVSYLTETNFGNVTTVQVLSVADSAALQVKERKFNTLVTRKIPTRTGDETFSTELYPTKRADDILSFLCLDEFIGNRDVSELDLDNIYGTVSDIISYFGINEAGEFSYTFDSSNLSFEEIFSSVANAIFCIGYRRGSKLKLSFEKLNEISTILFNHRNKIPGTESRTVIFGNNGDNDGVEFQYVDPSDDSIVSIYIPADKSARNPDVIESIGIRSSMQANLHANRIYNKMVYQNQSIEFEATQEANICILNDRILVSDGTRSGSFEGEVLEQNVLELTLSQNLNLLDDVDYTIFLQYKDGTVDSIAITKTDVANKILLASPPSQSLVLDRDMFAKTTFIITSNDDERKMAFLLTEKNPKGPMTSELRAINYNARYYQNDLDFSE